MPTPNTEADGRILAHLVKTIVLARHGKAVKINPADSDNERQLNALGLEQAIKLGKKLESFVFDAILSSPLPRARMTMAIAICGRYAVKSIPELTCDTGPESPIDKMWTELGNVPIVKYFEHSLGHELKMWAEIALHSLLENLSRLVHGRGTQTVLVGGHALLQNAFAYQIARVLRAEGMDSTNLETMTANEILSEGEAFVITLDRLSGNNRVIAEHLRLD
jgi:hypothetical protein